LPEYIDMIDWDVPGFRYDAPLRMQEHSKDTGYQLQPVTVEITWATENRGKTNYENIDAAEQQRYPVT
jgi:hypothetical protein